MVLPGTLPLSITRGIAFSGVVLRLADENVLVTGTLSPNVAGTFIATGSYAGYALYVLSGSPAYFLYFNTAAASYVISESLTDAALTDYWSPASPLLEPTGTYAPHGANTGTATATDNPIDLSGYLGVEAQVRRSSDAELFLDLNPSITDGPAGEITIPGMTNAQTNALTLSRNFQWDLVLTNGSNQRVGPFIKSTFNVSDNITQIIP